MYVSDSQKQKIRQLVLNNGPTRSAAVDGGTNATSGSTNATSGPKATLPAADAIRWINTVLACSPGLAKLTIPESVASLPQAQIVAKLETLVDLIRKMFGDGTDEEIIEAVGYSSLGSFDLAQQTRTLSSEMNPRLRKIGEMVERHLKIQAFVR